MTDTEIEVAANMPAETGTQEVSKNAADQKTEPKAELTIREKMFGSKASKAKDPLPTAEAAEPKAAADGETAKKTAKDRVMESRREAKAAKEEAERLKTVADKERAEREHAQKEMEQMQAELSMLRSIDDKNKSPRDLHREIVYEEKLNEAVEKLQNDLNGYCMAHKDPQMFMDIYNYYTPELANKDPWTLNKMHLFPERFKMLDIMYEAITNGIFTLDDWAKAPPPMKMQKLLELQKLARGSANPPAKAAKGEPNANSAMPDSVVPDFPEKPDIQNSATKGAAFKRAFERRRGK